MVRGAGRPFNLHELMKSIVETDADLCEDYEYDVDNRPSAKKH